MTERIQFVQFDTEPPTSDHVRLSDMAEDSLAYSDEGHYGLGLDAGLELVDTLKDAAEVLTGAMVLVKRSNTPPHHPLRPMPFMTGVLEAIDFRRAWHTRKGPNSPLV